MKDIHLIAQEQNHLRGLESLQSWLVQPQSTTTVSEIALADRFVALAFKQAGTRFLLLIRNAPSAKSLGSVRHLPYMRLRPARAQFGAVSPTGMWEPQHSSCISLRLPTRHLSHIAVSRGAPAVPRTCAVTAFPVQQRSRRCFPHLSNLCLPFL